MIFLSLIPVFFALLVVIRFTLLNTTLRPRPLRKPDHDAVLRHIDELEYELGIGPGGQRKLDEEMAAIEQAKRQKERAARRQADAEAAGQNMAVLAQTNPEEYWRRVAWNTWSEDGH